MSDISLNIKRTWDTIAKPLDSLGKFEKIVMQLGSIQKTENPSVDKSALLVLCADNGIVEEGVSQSSQSVTRTCAENIAQKITVSGVMATHTKTSVITADIGIACAEEIPGVINKKVRQGTRNFLKEPAMTSAELEEAFKNGASLVEQCWNDGYQIICIGEMGIGNTTAASAVAASLLGCRAETVVGRGAGLSDAGLTRKRDVVQNAIDKYRLYDAEPLEVLRTVGSLDMAGMVGVYEGARRCGIPVILDGAVSIVAALAAERIYPGVKSVLIPSHKSREPLSALVCEALGINPVIDADMALGEGTGALLMLGMIQTAVDVYNKALRFGESGVNQYKRF